MERDCKICYNTPEMFKDCRRCVNKICLECSTKVEACPFCRYPYLDNIIYANVRPVLQRQYAHCTTFNPCQNCRFRHF
jgi:hypothetical protein